MKKYYIGIITLVLITLGLTGYVLTIGIQSRQDVKTEKVAQTASTKLNNYISTKQKIPANLNEVGVSDVPSTITYTKVSSKEYKFCVTYKADKGYGGTDITSAVTGAAMSKVYGSYGGDYGDENASTQTSLYLNYTHKKGQECHNVKPYLSYSTNSPSILLEYCSPTNKYYSSYKDYCSEIDNNININTN